MAEYAVNLSSGTTDEQGIFRLLGKLFNQSGVVESTALTVAAQGTPDMTVKVSGSAATNNAVFLTSTGACYHGWNTADYNVTISANATGVTKTDAIVAYIDTAAGSGTANNPAGLKFIAVRRGGTDTGAVLDAEIDTATGNKPWIRLANITVANGAASINSGNIADTRTIGTTAPGWTASNESWAYASATTITVPSGATAKYAIGDRIKLTQTTVKYFVIVAVSSTTLTITGGSDYTLANAAITDPYYSKEVNPVGFPHWFNYTVTYTGFSSNPTGVSRFRVVGRECSVVYCRITNGTSNAVGFAISAPITSANISNMLWGGHRGIAVNNGAAVTDAGVVRLPANSSTITIWRTLADAAWTNSNSKGADFELTYEI